MSYLLYSIPILGTVLTSYTTTSSGTLLEYILSKDESDFIHDDATKKLWLYLIYIAPFITTFLAFITHGTMADYFGYKPTFAFIFISGIIGSLIQLIYEKSIVGVFAGQLIIGFSYTSVASQVWFNSMKSDEKATNMQIIYNYAIYIGSITSSVLLLITTTYVIESSWIISNLFIILCSFMCLLLLLFIYEPNKHRKIKIHLSCVKKVRRKETGIEKQPSLREIAYREKTDIFKIRYLTSCLCVEFILGMLDSVYTSYYLVQLQTKYKFSLFAVSLLSIIIDVSDILFWLIIGTRLCSLEYKKVSIISWLLMTILFITEGTLLSFDLDFKIKLYSFILCFSITRIISGLPFIMTRAKSQCLTPEKKRASYLSINMAFKSIGTIVSTFTNYYILPEPFLFFYYGGLCLTMIMIVSFSNKIDNNHF